MKPKILLLIIILFCSIRGITQYPYDIYNDLKRDLIVWEYLNLRSYLQECQSDSVIVYYKAVQRPYAFLYKIGEGDFIRDTTYIWEDVPIYQKKVPTLEDYFEFLTKRYTEYLRINNH